MARALLRFFRDRLEGLAILALLPVFAVRAARRGGREALRRAGPRWRRFVRRGLRDFRERWWDQARLESAACLWRYFFLAEWMASGRPAAGDRILLLRLGHIGDLLQAVPAVRRLKRERPGLAVDVLVGPWSAELARKFDCFADVLVYAPRVTQFDRGRRPGGGLRAEVRFLDSLGMRGYRAVVAAAPPHFCEVPVLLAARAPEVWGVAPDWPAGPAPWSAAHARPFDSRMYEADWIAACLAPAGVPPGEAVLEYPLDAAIRARARTRLEEAGIPPGTPYAVLAPGAGWPGKQWPSARFAELADWLAGEKGWRIVLAGSPAERDLCAEVAGRMRTPAANLGGRTDLDELAAVLEGAALFAGNDSGPMHMAAAVGAPTLTFWGPTFPEKWAPRGPRHLVVRPASPCAGCVYWHPRATCTGTPPCVETAPPDRETIAAFLRSLP